MRQKVDFKFLARHLKLKSNYSPAKWIKFCAVMLNLGFIVKLYKAKSTCSRYVFLHKDGMRDLKVRFSNHLPAIGAQEVNDSDFYVGVSNFGCITTEELIEKIKGMLDEKSK